MSSNFSFDTVWDEQVAISRGKDDLMMGPDGSYVKKTVHDQELAAQAAAIEAEQTNPDMIAGEVTPQTPGQVAQSFGEMVLGGAGGATAVTLGLLGDSYGALKGAFDAVGAENGQRLSTFFESFVNQSDSWGSGYFIQQYEDLVQSLDIPPQSKEMALAGSKYLGEWAEIPGAVALVVKGLKGASSALRAPSRTAQTSQQLDLLSNEPIIIENPDAGPLDRSQLPQPMPKPEPLPADVDELGFYQKAFEVARNLEQKRGTAQQFIKRLRQNGVSDEEIEALGLNEKFSNPNERITKDQFVQTINDRRIELEESIKGSDLVDEDEFDFSDITFGEGTPDRDSMNWQGRAEDFMYEIKQGDEYSIDRVLDQLKQNYPDDYSDEQIESIKQSLLLKEMDQLDARDRSNIDDASYDAAEAEYMENPYIEYRANETDTYTIYGNYDIGYQVLRYGNERVNDQEIYSLSEAQVIARQDAYEQGDLAGADSVTEARFENFMLPGGENYREILLRDPNTPTGGSKSHWSENDVIGHVLVKDRVDAQGNKTLYAEEVQSDFAQSARASSAEKTRMEMAQRRIESAQMNLDFANEQIAEIRAQIKSIDEQIKATTDPNEKARIFGKIDELNKEIAAMERRAAEANRDLDYYQESIAETEVSIAERAEKVGKTRFVKDTQQWLRPTMKRLIARAIEDGYDTVSVPPHQVVHERWNEDYGDFYRKSVPNTLLKVAKQLDPNARLEYSDLTESAFPGLGEEAASRGLKPGTKGLDRTPTIKITPAMREAYQEKGQSLFVPGAATVIAGKLVVDQMTKDQNND